jgi:hypothetical protein
MKKLLIVATIGLSASTSLLAQARVNFNNTGATPLTIEGVLPAPASIRVQLWVGPTAASLAPVLVGTSSSWNYATNSDSVLAILSGTFPGGNVVLPIYDGSTPLYFRARAWTIDPDDQTSYADRWASGTGYAGQTPIITGTPTPVPQIPLVLWGTGPNQWDGLTLFRVPEPSSFALVALGVVMALLRRRK